MAGKTSRAKNPRYEKFLNGEMDVEDLDHDELIRGQLRDKNGSFVGKPPLLIPRSFHQAVVRELVHRGEGRLKEHLDTAIDTMVEVAQNPRANPQARIMAAQYLWERVAGKIPDKHVVEASIRKWESVAEDVLVDIIEPKEK